MRLPAYKKCSLHTASHDRLLGSLDQHHVVPVSWQKHVYNPNPQYPGPDSEGRGELWDNRTVALAPSCHRNVHFWIVLHMHALADIGDTAAKAADAVAAVKAKYARTLAKWQPEIDVAILALTRLQDEAEGDLHSLIALRQWGEA